MKKIFPATALTLAVLQLVCVLISWIVSSVSPALPVRSLLGGEGIRWFLGSFTDNMSTPLLVWLIVGSVAYGTFVYRGLAAALRLVVRHEPLTYRMRHALLTVVAASVVILIAVSLLAFIPHAVLLGVTGSLLPSPFSIGFIPLLAFSVTVLSVIYGLVVGRFTDISSVFRSLYVGFYMSAPLLLIYILAVQLYASARYVLGFGLN